MTLQKKLLLAFGCLFVMVVVTSMLSLRSLSVGHDTFRGFVQKETHRKDLANEMLEAVEARAIAARNLVLVTTTQDLRLEEDAVKEAHQKVVDDLAELSGAVSALASSSAEEKALVSEIKRVEALYGPVALDIVGLALKGDKAAAIAKMNTECRPLLRELLKAGHDYLQYMAATGKKRVEAADNDYSGNRMMLIVASVLAAGIAVLLTWFLSRDVLRSLGADPLELNAAASKVAGGDLRQHNGLERAPANSVMASLGEMQQQLASLVGKVREASDSIAMGSSNIAAGNLDLSRRTENQAASLQETASAMEEISSTVRSNADTARQATQLAGSASEAADRGGKVVGEVVSTMGEIKSSSGQISDIIGVIDGIAFQTNILALNAAVEAARAGEQGRGFAVVATEVRALASRSIEAARQIKELIEVSVSKVEAGAALVTNAGSMMEDIVAQSRSVSGLISEISTATTEQTSGIEQVSGSISNLDQVTQQNAALVEESAAAAETLSHDSTRLAEMVGVFKLNQEST
ncbi:MAG: methyl-accepting chemotaxis protein [Burkholderiaceae bacterium]